MIGTYFAIDSRLYIVIDVWMGTVGESAEALLEDCDTGQFKWIKEEDLREAVRVHPD